MEAAAPEHTPAVAQIEPESRVVVRNIGWDLYVTLAGAGASSGTRFAYLEGDLEIMSPSPSHEIAKEMIGRLLEAYADEHGVELFALGSTTFRKRKRRAGFEPDKSYVLGAVEDPERVKRPDLAIEVVYSSWRIDKLTGYHRLGVPEVWVYRERRIQVHVRGEDDYEEHESSLLFPELDLALLTSFVDRRDQSTAVREYRQALRRDR